MFPGQYNKENLARVVHDPGLAAQEVTRVVRGLCHLPRQLLFTHQYGPGIPIMDQDWDYLIILDACRYDVFRDNITLTGDLRRAVSQGSHSVEFCEANFEGGEYHDTVYVTANGYGAQICKDVFHDMIFTNESDSLPDIDILHSTVTGLAPSTVYNTALEAYGRHPDKRLIVHFMQPHDPYLGQRAEELRQRVENQGLIVRARDPERIEKYSLDDENVVSSLAGAAKRGYISNTELKEVYCENLERVMEYVERLIGELEGKVVITADHGELLGEYGEIGHPKQRYLEELRIVPWFTIDSETRPDITEGKPVASTSPGNAAIERRLRALGYKE